MVKRCSDLLLASGALVVLLPFLLLVAVLVKLDSPGPVFFRHKRVGLNGRLFYMLKFRTMVVGAEHMGSRLTVKRDPRITPVGQILRWFKIDELPQLINVVRGEMSLIGPRPEDPYFVSHYTAAQRGVLAVRPGIVGPSQIYGRDELESYPEGLRDTEAYYLEHILPGKLARDLDYVARASFRSDMVLLLRGVWATVRGAVKGKFLWRRRNQIALFLADLLVVAVSFCLANLLRRDFQWPQSSEFVFVPLSIVLVVRAGALMYFGVYQGVLAYFGLWDLFALFKAVLLSALLGGGLTYFVGLQSSPRSVFLIDLGMAWFMLAGLRYGLRGVARWRTHTRRQRDKAIVVGTGTGGEQMARTLLEDPESHYRPVGFIDDAPEKWGAMIHGVPVLGGIAELPLAVSARAVRAVFICTSDVSQTMAREMVDMCQQLGVECRLVPTLAAMLSTDMFNGKEHHHPAADREVGGRDDFGKGATGIA